MKITSLKNDKKYLRNPIENTSSSIYLYLSFSSINNSVYTISTLYLGVQEPALITEPFTFSFVDRLLSLTQVDKLNINLNNFGPNIYPFINNLAAYLRCMKTILIYL